MTLAKAVEGAREVLRRLDTDQIVHHSVIKSTLASLPEMLTEEDIVNIIRYSNPVSLPKSTSEKVFSALKSEGVLLVREG